MKIFKKLKTQYTNKKKQQDQERLIEALKRPANQQRRPAAKFANIGLR